MNVTRIAALLLMTWIAGCAAAPGGRSAGGVMRGPASSQGGGSSPWVK